MNNLVPKNYSLKEKIKYLLLVVATAFLTGVTVHWFYVYWNVSTFDDKTTFAFLLVPTLIVLYASSLRVLGFGVAGSSLEKTE